MIKIKNKIIAHRGIYDNKTICENSITAFKVALYSNYKIELDIELTKDNQVVVFHDYNLKRMCNINKNIYNLKYCELINYKLLNTNDVIPLLKDVLNLVNGKVMLIIDLKKNNLNFNLEKELLKLLKNYNGKVWIQSFSIISIYWFKKCYPKIKRGLIVPYFGKKFYIKKFIRKILYNKILSLDFISLNKKYGINVLNFNLEKK